MSRAALEVFRAYAHPHKEALSLLHLGDAVDAAGRPEEARRHWSEALVVFERINAPEAEQARARLGNA